VIRSQFGQTVCDPQGVVSLFPCILRGGGRDSGLQASRRKERAADEQRTAVYRHIFDPSLGCANNS
jgi:hypothetical protein